jgi:hypothetical protein
MEALYAYVIFTSAIHVAMGCLLAGYYVVSAFENHKRLRWGDITLAIIFVGALAAAAYPTVHSVGELIA